MEIVGGLYHELCDFPRWRAIRGSGGRAAAVLAHQVNVSLHCYTTPREEPALQELSALGVSIHAHEAHNSMAFAYFHSLSTPHIEPAAGTFAPAPPFIVTGKTILRFGLLEGDAIVKASGRAVYDPQTSSDPAPFHANGSSAGEWALVVNARELSAIGGDQALNLAAARVHAEYGAAVVVAKCGPTGAKVFERHAEQPIMVPAYQSERVFKIGTGDVFSAAFALYWAERGMPAGGAADLASRAVAGYCENPLGGIGTEDIVERRPVPIGSPGTVLLLGASGTLGERYTLEEARFRLQELGAVVAAPALDATASPPIAPAVLIIADGMGDGEWACSDVYVARGARRIVFSQSSDHALRVSKSGDFSTSDFATAIYRAVWGSTSKP